MSSELLEPITNAELGAIGKLGWRCKNKLRTMSPLPPAHQRQTVQASLAPRKHLRKFKPFTVHLFLCNYPAIHRHIRL